MYYHSRDRQTTVMRCTSASCSGDPLRTTLEKGDNPMKFESLHDLYLSELSDIYSAEKQIVKALPKMIEKTESAELRQALEDHLEQTNGHVDRLEEVFDMHGESPKRQKCKGMEGILQEGDELVGQDATAAVRDAAIIAAAQRVEHYEMAVYGTLRTWANLMGHERAAAVLQETLDEEGAADEKLTSIAAKQVNIEATRTA
jgi:ferritin-like metal-binding protein YciE